MQDKSFETTAQHIDERLRQIYGRTANADVPDRFFDLIDDLKQEEERMRTVKTA